MAIDEKGEYAVELADATQKSHRAMKAWEVNRSLSYLCLRLSVSGVFLFPIARRRSRPTSPDHLVYKSTYSNTGSPTPSISGMTHFRSKALASTILNIFCTLIEAWVEQKMSDACIALAKRFAFGPGVEQWILARTDCNLSPVS